MSILESMDSMGYRISTAPPTRKMNAYSHGCGVLPITLFQVSHGPSLTLCPLKWKHKNDNALLQSWPANPPKVFPEGEPTGFVIYIESREKKLSKGFRFLYYLEKEKTQEYYPTAHFNLIFATL